MKLLKEQQEFSNEKKNAREQVEKKKSFLKIFMGIAGSMLLVIFLAFGLVYGNIKEIIIEQNIQMSMQAFEHVQSDIEEANETANLIATQVMLDDVCSEFLNAMQGQKFNSIALGRVRSQLAMYMNTNSIVESIYIYNSPLDLFISSGFRYGIAGKESFFDRNLVEILETPDAFQNRDMIRREMLTKYPNQMDKQETVYSYLQEAVPGEKENLVVVNLKFDSLTEKILAADAMKDSRLLIVDEKQEPVLGIQTIDVQGNPEFRGKVSAMIETGQSYMEYELDGEKYFISAIYSDKSSWYYVKATKWNTMFASLLKARNLMMIFLSATAVIVLLIALGNAASILLIHGKLEKKYAAASAKMKKSDMNVLRDGFLNNFIHGRKLFGRNRLVQEMEKFGFSIQENERFTIVILKIEAYNRFLEFFGKKEAYDIKFGFQNVFSETFEKEFRNVSLINRDDTITFILATGTDENPTARIENCFREFLNNVKVFAEWDFMLFGSNTAVSFEKLPEMNAELKSIVSEGFFYPENTFQTYEKLHGEHAGKTDLQQLDSEYLEKILKMDKDSKNIYMALTAEMKNSRMADYMNIMIWLGITLSRSRKLNLLPSQESNDFLVRLSKCEKAADADELFFGIFDKIQQKQEKNGSKKGVSGRLSEVRIYIEDNFRDVNLTMEQLGEEFGVSPNYLGQLFKKEIGVSIAEYISNERLKWVMKALVETNRPAKEIAEDGGFVNSNYFYTYFKKKVGMTPQAYREQFYESSEE